MGDSRNLGILLRHTFGCIDHNNDHICTFHSRYCTDNTVTLQFLFDLILPAQSCRINKYIFFSIPFDVCINSISGGASNIGYDHTVLTHQLIDNRRLSYIRFSNDSNLRTVILFCLAVCLRKMLYHFIQHVANAQTGRCRHRNRITDSQIIELIHICHEFLKTIYFVNYQDHRLVGTAQHICHLGICILQTLTHIHQENDHICGVDSDLCLLSHLSQNNIIAVRLNTACIDQCKIMIEPGDICIDSVPGHTWRIFYNRNILSRQGIKQCGFAHIRTPHNCYYWSAHILNLFLLILD